MLNLTLSIESTQNLLSLICYKDEKYAKNNNINDFALFLWFLLFFLLFFFFT
jgi:hypothetical protein